MREWRIHRYTTFDDNELASVLNKVESKPGYKIQQVLYMGDNVEHVRIYQIIYTVEK